MQQDCLAGGGVSGQFKVTAIFSDDRLRFITGDEDTDFRDPTIPTVYHLAPHFRRVVALQIDDDRRVEIISQDQIGATGEKGALLRRIDTELAVFRFRGVRDVELPTALHSLRLAAERGPDLHTLSFLFVFDGYALRFNNGHPKPVYCRSGKELAVDRGANGNEDQEHDHNPDGRRDSATTALQGDEEDNGQRKGGKVQRSGDFDHRIPDAARFENVEQSDHHGNFLRIELFGCQRHY